MTTMAKRLNARVSDEIHDAFNEFQEKLGAKTQGEAIAHLLSNVKSDEDKNELIDSLGVEGDDKNLTLEALEVSGLDFQEFAKRALVSYANSFINRAKAASPELEKLKGMSYRELTAYIKNAKNDKGEPVRLTIPGLADLRIEKFVAEVMTHNESRRGEHAIDDRYEITPTLIYNQGINMKSAQKWLESHKEEIKAHHEAMEIEPGHNRGKDIKNLPF